MQQLPLNARAGSADAFGMDLNSLLQQRRRARMRATST